jgi:hypothetical protein
VITAVTGIAVIAPTVIPEKTDFRPVIVIDRSAGVDRFSNTPGERRQQQTTTHGDDQSDE